MQVGTYPTRNFATLGPFICVNDRRFRSRLEITPNPSCRHEDRTISSSLVCDAWRVVSEDSSLRWPFLLIICTFAFSRGDPSNPRLKPTADNTDLSGFLLRSSRYSDFPAYSQVCSRNYNSAHDCFVRGVLFIVTAAIHWGFDS